MDEDLSRREKRKLMREEQKEGSSKTSLKKIIIIAVILSILGLIGYWIYKSLTTPLPGLATKDLGRDHVTDIFGVVYDTIPPSSGKHFPIWAKAGLYDRALSDGYLIHSQEHGYVVISYNCSQNSNVKAQNSKLHFKIKEALAHDEPTKNSTDSGQLLMHMNYPKTDPDMGGFTPSNPPEKEIELPEAFGSENCKSLVTNLKKYLKTAPRIVIVPRPNLDAQISLNAWSRIDKFNLTSMPVINSEEDARIVKFIKAFHNKGPEKTTE